MSELFAWGSRIPFILTDIRIKKLIKEREEREQVKLRLTMTSRAAERKRTSVQTLNVLGFPCKLNPTVQCLLRPETNLLVTLYFMRRHFNGTERGKISRKIANLWVTHIGMNIKLSKIFYVDQISRKIWLQWSYDRRMRQSSPEPCETTALLDSAAARLVKIT